MGIVPQHNGEGPKRPESESEAMIEWGGRIQDLAEKAIASANLGIAIADGALEDCPLVYVNPEFERITGYRFDEIVGQNCRFLQGPGTAKDDIARMRGAIADCVPVEVVVLNYRKDGSTFWNHVRIQPVFDPGREAPFFIGYASDVSTFFPILRARRSEAITNDNRLPFSFLGVCTPEGVLTEASRGSLERYDLSANDALGRSLWELPWWEDDPRAVGFLKAAVDRGAAGIASQQELRLSEPSGRVSWIEVRVTPGLDESGKVTHLVPSAMDVTDRIQIDRLRGRFSEVVDGTPEAVLSIGPDGTIVYVNPAGIQLLAAESDQLVLGQPFSSFLEEASASVLDDRILPTVQVDGTWEGEIQLRALDDRLVPTSTAFIAHSEDGQLRYVSALIQDRTDSIRQRQRLLLELRVSQVLDTSDSMETAIPAVLKTLLDSLEFSVAEYYGIVQEGELSAPKFAEYNPKLPIAMAEAFCDQENRVDFVHGEGLPGVTWATNEPRWVEDVNVDPHFTRKDLAQELGLTTAFAFPVSTDDGPFGVFTLFATGSIPEDPYLVDAAINISRNIREFDRRARAERRLRRAQLAAEEANRAKSRFLAHMSHELRTPMAAILGYTELLISRVDGEARQMLEVVQRNGSHMVTMLNDILDLTKVEEGRLEVVFEAYSPVSLVEDLASLMRVKAAEKGLDFEVQYEGGIPVELVSDSVRLRQILINLVGNAIKFTSEGSITLTLRGHLSEASPHVEYEVSDTGIGVPADRLEAIFQPFDQGHANVERQYGGTGLGLTISRRLAEILGGEITATSRVGEGSIFRLRVPVAGAQTIDLVSPEEIDIARAKDVPDGFEPPAALAGTFLVVDDHTDIRRLVGHYIEEAGGEVEMAADGRQAIEAVQKRRGRGLPAYAGIVMDMQMPVMSGHEATRQIRESLPETPIIALSAGAMERDRKRALDAGCDDFLPKPVEGARLISRLAEVATATERPQRPEVTHHRILLVEDDRDLADATGSILEHWGHGVRTVYSGQEALESFSSDQTSVVFLDLNLPDMDGFTVLSALREQAAEESSGMTPQFVALSGDTTEDTRRRVDDAGFDHFLAKPATLPELRDFLESAPGLPGQYEEEE